VSCQGLYSFKVEHGTVFDLEKESLEKTKIFARLLFETDISGKITWFDKLDNSMYREDDPEMTLDKYLERVTESVLARYIVGRDEVFPGEDQRINGIGFILVDKFKDSPNVRRHAWFKCPMSEENYQKVDELFQEAYGVSMEEYPHILR